LRSPLWLLLFGPLLAWSSGCASYFEGSTEEEGTRIEAEKREEVAQFRRDDLIDPRREGPVQLVEVSDVEGPDPLSLDGAIEIATAQNRDYQSRREALFLSALDLGVTRRDFLRPVFAGSVGWEFSDGTDLDYSDVTSLSLGADYLLFTGGNLSLNSNLSMSNDSQLTGSNQSTSGSNTLSFSQPLLQGAGHAIAFEGLTQAERNLLYQAREFELFRQQFVIDIIDDFYELLSQKQQLVNTRENIERQTFAYEQAQALFRLGRGDSLSVFRAEQSLLQAQDQLLNDEQAYRVAFDRFKIQLGLPTETSFDIEAEFPAVNELSVGLDAAVEAALNNRLDLRTDRDQVIDRSRQVTIARDSVLPRFDLSASYTTSTDAETSLRGLDFHEEGVASVGLTLEIPFDRKQQRANLRSAEIGLSQARRDLDRREDEVVLEIRSSLGTLRQRRTQIEIGIREIGSLERSYEKATLEFESGLATNRDVTEAADELTAAQNNQLDRIVDHEIARLTLLRQLGLLFVEESGLVRE